MDHCPHCTILREALANLVGTARPEELADMRSVLVPSAESVPDAKLAIAAIDALLETQP